MTAEEFDQTIRSFAKRRPFFPFVVELLNGERIVVPFPRVADFRSDEEGLVEFSFSKVSSIHVLEYEAAP